MPITQERCIKCGMPKEAWFRTVSKTNEYELLVTCICGYRWTEPTLDAPAAFEEMERHLVHTIDGYTKLPVGEFHAALAAVEQEIAELRKDCDVWEEAAEALEAELDELRKDKKRLDWLDMNCVTHLPEQRGAPATDSWCFMSRPAPLREAIDIALYAEKAKATEGVQ